MSFCLIQVRLEGRDKPVDVEYTQGTSVQAVLERACKILGIYDSWNYALYSKLFQCWLCESYLLSSHPAEDTLIVRKKTTEYLELIYNEEHPKKRSLSSSNLSPNASKRRGVFSPKTCLKGRFHMDTIYLSVILFTSDSKVLIMSGSKVFPTVEIVRDRKLFYNVEDDSDEFAHALRTSLDWATSTEFDKDDSSSDTDSLLSTSSYTNTIAYDPDEYYFTDNDSLWTRSFGQAVIKLKNELSLDSLGALYEHVVSMPSTKSKFIVTLQYVPHAFKDDIASDLVKAGTLKWKNFTEISPIYEKDPHPIWTNFIEKWCSRKSKLSPGLYLGVFYAESTLQGIRVMVPQERKQFIPIEKIRDDANITPEEASWLKSLTCLSQASFMDLVASASEDLSQSSAHLGRFQTGFIDAYHKLQTDTNLTWDANDIYSEQTVDLYLDLQTNQMFTMMGELDDNVDAPYGSLAFNEAPQSNSKKQEPETKPTNEEPVPAAVNSKTTPVPAPTSESVVPEPITAAVNAEQAADTDAFAPSVYSEAHSRLDSEHSDQFQENMDEDGEQMQNAVITENKKSNNRDNEEEGIAINIISDAYVGDDESVNLLAKTTHSAEGGSSLTEDASTTIVGTSYATNTMKPFIRVILIVKPMKQPHQIRNQYRSVSCILYPFNLFDALQHATFNACLYASSRRAMQILQASRTYFAQELVRHLQKHDRFAEINEQNVEDYFLDPEYFNNIPEEARQIQQVLDILRDEITQLKQQWNSVSWSMTVIEWDRQRIMQSYCFGGRSTGFGIGRLSGSYPHSRASSSYSTNRSETDLLLPGNGSNKSSVSLASTVRRAHIDTASQIEYLRDVLLHSPDRAWSHIRLIGVPIPTFSDAKQQPSSKPQSKNTTQGKTRQPSPILRNFLANSPVTAASESSISFRDRASSVSSISSMRSTKTLTAPVRKKSAGHRLMKTLGFGSGNRGAGSAADASVPVPPVFQMTNKEPKRSSTKLDKGLVDEVQEPDSAVDLANITDDVLSSSPTDNIVLAELPTVFLSRPLTPSFVLTPNDSRSVTPSDTIGNASSANVSSAYNSQRTSTSTLTDATSISEIVEGVEEKNWRESDAVEQESNVVDEGKPDEIIDTLVETSPQVTISTEEDIKTVLIVTETETEDKSDGKEIIEIEEDVKVEHDEGAMAIIVSNFDNDSYSKAEEGSDAEIETSDDIFFDDESQQNFEQESSTETNVCDNLSEVETQKSEQESGKVAEFDEPLPISAETEVFGEDISQLSREEASMYTLLNDEPNACESSQMDVTEMEITEAESTEVKIADVEDIIAEVECAEVETAGVEVETPEVEVGTEVDMAEVDTAEVDTAEVDTAEMEMAEVENTEIETVEAEITEVVVAEAESAEQETAKVEVAKVESTDKETTDIETTVDVTDAESADVISDSTTSEHHECENHYVPPTADEMKDETTIKVEVINETNPVDNGNCEKLESSESTVEKSIEKQINEQPTEEDIIEEQTIDKPAVEDQTEKQTEAQKGEEQTTEEQASNESAPSSTDSALIPAAAKTSKLSAPFTSSTSTTTTAGSRSPSPSFSSLRAQWASAPSSTAPNLHSRSTSSPGSTSPTIKPIKNSLSNIFNQSASVSSSFRSAPPPLPLPPTTTRPAPTPASSNISTSPPSKIPLAHSRNSSFSPTSSPSHSRTSSKIATPVRLGPPPLPLPPSSPFFAKFQKHKAMQEEQLARKKSQEHNLQNSLMLQGKVQEVLQTMGQELRHSSSSDKLHERHIKGLNERKSEFSIKEAQEKLQRSLNEQLQREIDKKSAKTDENSSEKLTVDKTGGQPQIESEGTSSDKSQRQNSATAAVIYHEKAKVDNNQQDDVQIDGKAVEELNDSQQDNVHDKAVEELNDSQQDNVQIDDKA
ncbi:5132_t:CDS:2, partial [Paraglomus occultum]